MRAPMPIVMALSDRVAYEPRYSSVSPVLNRLVTLLDIEPEGIVAKVYSVSSLRQRPKCTRERSKAQRQKLLLPELPNNSWTHGELRLGGLGDSSDHPNQVPGDIEKQRIGGRWWWIGEVQGLWLANHAFPRLRFRSGAEYVAAARPKGVHFSGAAKHGHRS
jgi:hypothetical protein